MSLTLNFFNNKSDRNVMSKTLETTGMTALQGVTANILEPYSIERPRFILDYTSQIGRANYFQVTESGRYYFMDSEPELLSGGRMIITGSVDVLMSYRAQILAQDAIIERNENLVSTYITDPEVVIASDIEPDQAKFPSSPLLKNLQFYLITSGGET